MSVLVGKLFLYFMLCVSILFLYDVGFKKCDVLVKWTSFWVRVAGNWRLRELDEDHGV